MKDETGMAMIQNIFPTINVTGSFLIGCLLKTDLCSKNEVKNFENTPRLTDYIQEEGKFRNAL